MTKKQSSSSSSSEDQSSQQQPIKYISVQVSKLTPNVNEQHLQQIFSHFGTVKSVSLKKGPKLTSTATLQFQKKNQAQYAITHMNNGYIDGSKIVVESQFDFNKTQKNVQKRKSQERGKRQQYTDNRTRRSRQRQRDRNYNDRRSKDRHSRDKRQRNRRKVSSSSSSSSSVGDSSSDSSSDDKSSRS